MISSLGSSGGMNVAQRRQMFSSADSNGDASLSKDELLSALTGLSTEKGGKDASALADKMFTDMDSDQDGAVTEAEFTAFQARFSPDTGNALVMAQQQRPSADEMMAETDTDGDGAISTEELAAVLEKHSGDSQAVDDMFDAMDSDQDGSVDKDELTAFAAQGPQGGPPGGSGGGAAAAASSSSQDYDPLDTNKDGVVSLAERMASSGTNNATDPTGSGNLASRTLGALLQSLNEVAA